MRIDLYLVDKGFCESRSRAARLISEGKVFLDGKSVTKASFDVDDGEHEIEITELDRFVGRGGLKLEGAMEHFGIDVEGKRCIDVGASTGGFTDCLLQNGAAHVCAVDSGRGQLHPKLLDDIRVTSLEGFNARALSPDDFGYFDVAVMDVSFISATYILPQFPGLLREGGHAVCLIKPHFEVGRSMLGKGGIVKKASDRYAAVIRVLDSAASCKFQLLGVMRSPIDGGDGNREYLAVFKKVSGLVDATDTSFIKALCKD